MKILKFEEILKMEDFKMKCQYGGNRRKLCDNYFDCGVCFARSFGASERSICWNYQENKGLTPRDVTISCGKKFWFTCDECKHEFEIKISNVNQGQWCPYCCNPPKKLCDKDNCDFCYKKSFASHSKAKYWHPTENGDIKPRNVFPNSNKNFWFICVECKHDFETVLYAINSDQWCPYCTNKKLCDKDDCKFCFDKSFAHDDKAKFWNYKENGDIRPRDVFLNCNSKFSFKCGECKHKFESSLNNIGGGKWCPYCANQKLCNSKCKSCFDKSFASSTKAKFWHKTKNKITPRKVFKNSGTKRWFTCGECKHDFKQSLNHISGKKQTWCPYCKNKTEKMFADWLTDEKIPFEREKKFDWCINLETDRHFPFDFYLPNHNVIIEIDGRQHVEEVKHFRNDLQTIQERDGYKENLAIENGIHVIRICQEDIYYNRIDWEKEVLETLEEIKNKEPEIWCIGTKGYY